MQARNGPCPPRKRGESREAARCYDSWRQVTGYFDGDGAVYVSGKMFVLRIKLCFYDVWKKQLENVGEFMRSKGVVANRLAAQRRPLTTVWYLTVANSRDIRVATRHILPFASKKRGDLLVAQDYLSDRITADEAILRLNEFVRDKRRSGYIRKVNIPYTHTEGILEGRRFGASVGARARLVSGPKSTRRAIRRDQAEFGISVSRLHTKYGYSPRIIQRILRDCN